MNWPYVWDILKKAGRAAGSAAVGILIAQITNDFGAGVISAAVYGLIGKILRELFPGFFGRLPVL